MARVLAFVVLPLAFLVGIGPAATTNSTDAPFLRINVTLGSPIFVIIRWEVVGASARVLNNIETLAIQITDIHSTTDPDPLQQRDYPSFKITVPGSNTTQYIFGPIGDGTEFLNVQFTIQVEDVFDTELEQVVQAGTAAITLPTCFHLDCNYPDGHWDVSCSQCVCRSLAFSGPNCRDPEFYPREVSVWPESATVLNVTWYLNQSIYARALAEYSGLQLMYFRIDIVGGITIQIPVVPLSQQSYAIERLETGMEYQVTVSTVSEGVDGTTVMGSAPPVRAFIDPGLFPERPTCAVPDEECRSATTSEDFSSVSVGTMVGAVLGAALVVGVVSIGITLLCVRNVQPRDSHFRGRHHRRSTKLSQNPAYGHGRVNPNALVTEGSLSSSDGLLRGLDTGHTTTGLVVAVELDGEYTDGTGEGPTYDYVYANDL